MGCGMDLLQGSDGNLRVNLRGLDVLVAEHLLDKRMSAPFSCISVAIVCRKRWQEPVLPSLAASMRSLTAKLR
jgi:hypothetical protein